MPPQRLPYGKPFVLQLAYDLADFEMVRAHWAKNFLRRFGPDAPVRALMARALHQIRADGYVLRTHYVFPLADVAVDSDEDTREAQVHEALAQLGDVCFRFELPTQQRCHVRHLLNGADQQVNGYTSTHVTLVFNPQLGPYLFNVAQLDELFPPA